MTSTLTLTFKLHLFLTQLCMCLITRNINKIKKRNLTGKSIEHIFSMKKLV